MSYATLLQDPRWHEKRQEALQFHGNACGHCGTASSLQVHHPRYMRGRMPWQYRVSELEVLCRACHEQEHPRQTLRSNLQNRLNALLLGKELSEQHRSEITALQAALRVLK
jgi:5-methylcytosine-specific restriction endonuclease McrA